MQNSLQDKLYKDICERGEKHIKKFGVDISYLEERKNNSKSVRIISNFNRKVQLKLSDKISKLLNNELSKFKQKLHIHNPQYFHTTILSVKSRSSDLNIDDNLFTKLIDIGNNIVNKLKPIKFSAYGLGLSESTIFLKVYSDESLNYFRTEFKNILLSESINYHEKYPLIGAHISIARFKEPLDENEIIILLNFIEKYKDYFFLDFNLEEFILVEKLYNIDNTTKSIIKHTYTINT